MHNNGNEEPAFGRIMKKHMLILVSLLWAYPLIGYVLTEVKMPFGLAGGTYSDERISTDLKYGNNVNYGLSLTVYMRNAFGLADIGLGVGGAYASLKNSSSGVDVSIKAEGIAVPVFLSLAGTRGIFHVYLNGGVVLHHMLIGRVSREYSVNNITRITNVRLAADDFQQAKALYLEAGYGFYIGVNRKRQIKDFGFTLGFSWEQFLTDLLREKKWSYVPGSVNFKLGMAWIFI